jgi:lipopolysaccharide transport system ATP-binding protein
VINNYLKNDYIQPAIVDIDPDSHAPEQLEFGFAKFIRIEDFEGRVLPQVAIGQYWQVRVRFRINKPLQHFIVAIGLHSSSQIPIWTCWSTAMEIQEGEYEAIFKNDNILLASGNYPLTLGLSNYEKSFHTIENVISLEVADIKNDSIKNDSQLIRTAGSGLILNQSKVIINKQILHEFEKL